MLAASGGGGAPLGEGGGPGSILGKLDTSANPAGEPPALKLVALELTMDKLQREIPKMMEALQEKILASIPAKIEEELSRKNISEALSAPTTSVASAQPMVPTEESLPSEEISRLEARLMQLEARPSRGSELARCVGMMDAELEMAMIGRLDKLANELREQMDGYDKRQASLGTELKLVHVKLNACVGDCSRLDVRMFELEQLSAKESLSPRSGLKLSKPESSTDPGIGRTYGSVGDLDSLASTARSTTSARSRFIEDARGAYACHRVDKEDDGRAAVGSRS